MSNKLPREFYYTFHVLAVARELLGKPWWCRLLTVRRVPESSSKPKPIGVRRTSLNRDVAPNARRRCTQRWNGLRVFCLWHVSPVQRSNQYRGHPSCSLDSRIGTFRRSGVYAPAPSWTTDLNLTTDRASSVSRWALTANGPGGPACQSSLD